MKSLSLVHLTVDQPAVRNLPVIQQWLLQSFTQLLAVKIDSDVPAGVNVATYSDFLLLIRFYYLYVLSILYTHSLFIFCYIISFLLLLFNP